MQQHLQVKVFWVSICCMPSSLILRSFAQKLAEDDTHVDIGNALMGIGGVGLAGAGLMAGHKALEGSVQRQVEQYAKQHHGGSSTIDKILMAAPLVAGGVSWAANKVKDHNIAKAERIMGQVADVEAEISRLKKLQPISSGAATARPWTVRSPQNIAKDLEKKPLITPTTDPNSYYAQAVKSAEDDNRTLIGGAGLLAAGGAGAYLHSQHQSALAAQRAAQEAAAAQRSANIAKMKGIGKGVAGGLGIAGLLAGLGAAGNFAKNKVVQHIEGKEQALNNVMQEAAKRGINVGHPEWTQVEKGLQANMPIRDKIMNRSNKLHEYALQIGEQTPASQAMSIPYHAHGITDAQVDNLAKNGINPPKIDNEILQRKRENWAKIGASTGASMFPKAERGASQRSPQH